MSKADNKLSGAIALGTLGVTPLNKKGVVNSSDRDSLYRFTLGDRNRLSMDFTAAKGAGYEIYWVKQSWNKVLKSIGSVDFRQLRGRKLGGNLQRVNPGELDAGDYIIRVLHRSGKSRYQFQVATQTVEIPPIKVEIPPTKTEVEIPPVKVEIPPVKVETPSVQLPQAVSDRFAFSGYPSGGNTYFEIDFAKNRDEDPREDYGLFRGAILSSEISTDYPNIPWNGSRKAFQPDSAINLKSRNGGSKDYQPGDLIAFKNAAGETEYRAILFSQDGVAVVLGFEVKLGANADPDSLSSLKAAMAKPGDVRATMGFGSRQSFLEGTKTLETLELYSSMTFGLNTTYILNPNQQDYTLTTINLDPSGSLNSSNSKSFNVNGNDLDNAITGNDSDNILKGKKGKDQLFGKGGNDSLYGDEEDDTLYGENGTDSLYGGIGNDRLEGGEGDDDLTGFGSVGVDASEFDILIGGGGSDRFVLGGYNSQSSKSEPFYVESGDGYAIIQDWQPGIDKIYIYGDTSLYRFEYKNVIGSSTTDIEIYYTSGGISDRIAIIQDTSAVINPAVDFI